MNNPKTAEILGKTALKLGVAYYSGYFFKKGEIKAEKEEQLLKAKKS